MANLHQKMLEVMKNIEYLKKDDHVDYGKNPYRAMSEEKVTSVVRAELIKQGIVVYPIKQTVEREGIITTTNTTYRMVNVDDPTDYIELASSGQGADTQDKGVGKAMTYSFKYMLLRTFAIPTGEDPDKIASEKIDDEQKVAKIKDALMRADAADRPIDVQKFLLAIGGHWKNKKGEPKIFNSIDDMKGEELDYALMRLEEREKGI